MKWRSGVFLRVDESCHIIVSKINLRSIDLAHGLAAATGLGVPWSPSGGDLALLDDGVFGQVCVVTLACCCRFSGVKVSEIGVSSYPKPGEVGAWTRPSGPTSGLSRMGLPWTRA